MRPSSSRKDTLPPVTRHHLDGGAVDQPERLVIAGPADAVAGAEFDRLGPVDLAAAPPSGDDRVQRALGALTVRDLIGKLHAATRNLSASSNVKDIVFLVQNLYTLGGLAMTADIRRVEGPLKSILGEGG